MTADDWGWTCIRHHARGRGLECPLCKRDRNAGDELTQLRQDLAAQVEALAALAAQVRALSWQIEAMRMNEHT